MNGLKQKNGFTLLEALVIITIIGIVVTISSLNLNDSDRNFAIDATHQQFISTIEKAKSDAINGVYTDPNVEPVVHGVHIFNNATTYSLFTSSDDNEYDASEDTRTITLPLGMTFSTSETLPLDLSFELFSGDFYVTGSLPSSPVSIHVVHTASSESERVTINEEGLILTTGDICGDGVIQIGEACDYNGDTFSNDNNSPVACNAICQIEYCGDGIIQDGTSPRFANGTPMPGNPNRREQCDSTGDGTCTTQCQISGGGGCGSISPYTEPPTGPASMQFLIMLTLLPFITYASYRYMDRFSSRK
jgi:type II secretory pathway pseudopilin PulG